jgi:hypothetical protein
MYNSKSLLNRFTGDSAMNKLFPVLIMFLGLFSSGCMTHYANFRTLSSGQHQTINGGVVRYSHTESYSYDSGYREYPRYYDPNSLPAYAPVTVQTWHYRPSVRWHDIPNPLRRGGHYPAQH